MTLLNCTGTLYWNVFPKKFVLKAPNWWYDVVVPAMWSSKLSLNIPVIPSSVFLKVPTCMVQKSPLNIGINDDVSFCSVNSFRLPLNNTLSEGYLNSKYP